MKEILLKCIVVSLSISLLIVICTMIFDMVKTLISLKKTKKNKNDEKASEREELLKSDEKMYSIINRARAILTEEEKSHILNYVKEAHSCNSISCFWLNKLSYITVFDGGKIYPHLCIGVLIEKVENPIITLKNGFTIRNEDKTSSPYIVSFVAYNFKEEFSGRNTLPLYLEEYVVSQKKYEQIMNNFIFRNCEEYMYLDLHDGNCLFYNDELITVMSTKEGD